MKKIIFGALLVLMLFAFVGCGEKDFTCSQCAGSGECTFCFGSGERNGYDCSDCNATGKCYKCMGTGEYHY
ncbi:MAG: hypothetical protein E7064_03925 [Spirochaetaceae bacterium]|nr:hypothetical protein [Spirochaetaceae bacterium]